MRKIIISVLNWLSSKKHSWKISRIRRQFAQCGDCFLVYGNPKISFPKRMKLGNGVTLNDGCVLNATSSSIEIGSNCTISSGAQILAATYDVETFLIGHNKHHISKPVVIGDNVWVCAGAIICPGVHIMGGAIIAAGAVVTKDITEKNVIVAGNPAKIIRRL